MHYMHADMGNMDECLERALKRKVKIYAQVLSSTRGFGGVLKGNCRLDSESCVYELYSIDIKAK